MIKLKYLLIILPVSLSFFVIWTAAKNPLIADDFSHIIYNPLLNGPILWSEFIGKAWVDGLVTWAYRPVYYLTFYVERHTWGLKADTLRLVNLALHFANVLLLILILKRKRIVHSFGAFHLVITAGLLHPILWHSILYASARSTLLVSHFILMAVFISTFRIPLSIVAVGPVLLSFFTKATGILSLPLIVLLGGPVEKRFLISRDFLRRRKWQGLGALILFATLFVASSFHAVRKFYEGLIHSGSFAFDYSPYVATQVVVLTKYLWTMLINPFSWSFYHFTTPVMDFGDVRFYGALAVLFALLTLWYKFRRYLDQGIALSILVTFLPEMFYPRELLGTEQRCYLPLLLFVALAGQLYDRFHLSKFKIRSAALTSIVGILLFSISIKRAQVYESVSGIMKNDLENNPENLEARLMLARALTQQSEYQQAQRHLVKFLEYAGEIAPVSSWTRESRDKAYYLLSHVSLQLKDLKIVQNLVDGCEDREGVKQSTCRLIRAHLYSAQGNPEKIVNEFKSLPMITAAENQELIKALTQLGKYNEALALISFHKNNFADDLTLTVLEGNIYLSQNDFKNALRVLREAYAKRANIDPIQAELLHKEIERLKNLSDSSEF